MARPLRRLLFALAPTALLFGAVELGLRASGLADGVQRDLQATAGLEERAWVQRRDVHLGPAFVPGVVEGEVRTSPAHQQRGMHSQALPVRSEGETRLFALGGSTVVGIPFEQRERGFPARLETHLGAAMPDRRWRIVNLGVPGMDSRAFPDLAREAVALGAHGLLVYAGENEPRGTAVDECSNPLRTGLERRLDRLATVRAGRALLRPLLAPVPVGVEELARDQTDCMRAAVQQSRQQDRGLPGDRRTDPLAERTVEAFGENLAEVARVARRAGIPVWLAVPPVNLRHPPALALSHPSVPPEPARAFARELEAAAALRPAGRLDEAHATLAALVARDPAHAQARYELGMVLLARGELRAARPHLQAAVDLDWLAQRATGPLQQAARDFCAAHPPPAVTCVDLDAAFTRAAPDGVPGDSLFVDFCHPTFQAGVDLIVAGYADALTRWVGGG